MRVADNVEILEIENERGTLNPVLTWDNDELILIDTGLPGQIELFREAVKQAGFDLEKITKVILTHQDMDHIGCAKVLSDLGAEILAHEAEIPFLQGDATPVRIARMEARLEELNEEERANYEQTKANAPLFYVHVDRQLKDNEDLPFCGGIKVIHTPGHMPGHIVLLLKKSNIMVVGDAANLIDGKLTGANPVYTSDMEGADLSFKKMMEFNPDYVACYHGGLYTVGSGD